MKILGCLFVVLCLYSVPAFAIHDSAHRQTEQHETAVIGAISNIARISDGEIGYNLVAHVSVTLSDHIRDYKVIIHQRVDGTGEAHFNHAATSHGSIVFVPRDPETTRCIIQHCRTRYLGTVHLSEPVFRRGLTSGLPLRLQGHSGTHWVHVPRALFQQVMNSLPMS